MTTNFQCIIIQIKPNKTFDAHILIFYTDKKYQLKLYEKTSSSKENTRKKANYK